MLRFDKMFDATGVIGCVSSNLISVRITVEGSELSLPCNRLKLFTFGTRCEGDPRNLFEEGLEVNVTIRQRHEDHRPEVVCVWIGEKPDLSQVAIKAVYGQTGFVAKRWNGPEHGDMLIESHDLNHSVLANKWVVFPPGIQLSLGDVVVLDAIPLQLPHPSGALLEATSVWLQGKEQPTIVSRFGLNIKDERSHQLKNPPEDVRGTVSAIPNDVVAFVDVDDVGVRAIVFRNSMDENCYRIQDVLSVDDKLILQICPGAIFKGRKMWFAVKARKLVPLGEALSVADSNQMPQKEVPEEELLEDLVEEMRTQKEKYELKKEGALEKELIEEETLEESAKKEALVKMKTHGEKEHSVEEEMLKREKVLENAKAQKVSSLKSCGAREKKEELEKKNALEDKETGESKKPRMRKTPNEAETSPKKKSLSMKEQALNEEEALLYDVLKRSKGKSLEKKQETSKKRKNLQQAESPPELTKKSCKDISESESPSSSNATDGLLLKKNSQSLFILNGVGVLKRSESMVTVIVTKSTTKAVVFAPHKVYVAGTVTDMSTFYSKNKRVFFDAKRLVNPHYSTGATFMAIYCWVGVKPTIEVLSKRFLLRFPLAGEKVREELSVNKLYSARVSLIPSPLFCIATTIDHNLPVLVTMKSLVADPEAKNAVEATIDSFLSEKQCVSVRCEKRYGFQWATLCSAYQPQRKT